MKSVGEYLPKPAERRATESNKATARRTYTVNEFCEAFRLSRATTFRLIASGKLKSVRVLGRRLILADSAEALLEEAV